MKTAPQSINFRRILSEWVKKESMRIKIKAFGITKDIVGSREIIVEATGQTVAALREHLNEKYPALVKLKSLFIAVNNKYADEHTMLNDTDEVALIPPVSGG